MSSADFRPVSVSKLTVAWNLLPNLSASSVRVTCSEGIRLKERRDAVESVEGSETTKR